MTRLEAQAQAKRAIGRQVGGFAKPDWARGCVAKGKFGREGPEGTGGKA